MEEQIKQGLERLCFDNSVSIMYACESGSRAWGFESVDSDWDVRFIYLQKPQKYISIFEDRDVVEVMDEKNKIDYSGWDFKKALFLLSKSNPPLLEWLNSPIVYYHDHIIYNELFRLSETFYNPISCIYHYYHMARNNYFQYIKGRDELWIKKYFYVLRPLLAVQWIEKYNEIPPVQFTTLWHLLADEQLVDDVIDLTFRKRKAEELRWGAKVDSISLYIDSEIRRLDDTVGKHRIEVKQADKQLLNDFYYDIIKKNVLWGWAL